MGVPVTTGVLCNSISEMQIGDYIKCSVHQEKEKMTFKMGSDAENLNEIDVNTPPMTAEGLFYFLKVDKNKILADRRIVQRVSYTDINAMGLIKGKVRCPSQAEFSAYITNSTLDGKIKQQDINVWHGTIEPTSDYSDFGKPNFHFKYPEILSDDIPSGQISTNGINFTNSNTVCITVCNMSGAKYNANAHQMKWHYSAGDSRSMYIPVYYDKSFTYLDNKPNGGYTDTMSAVTFRPLLEINPEPTVVAPTNLTAATGDTKVTLSWTAVEGATSYIVKRSTTSGGTYTTIASDVTDTTYVDSNVTNGTTYYYVVVAVTAEGESNNSNEASATPVAPIVDASKVLLRITMNDSSEREYKITQNEVNNFIKWINGTGRTGDNCYKFDDVIDDSIEYLIFEKMISFKILEL